MRDPVWDFSPVFSASLALRRQPRGDPGENDRFESLLDQLAVIAVVDVEEVRDALLPEALREVHRARGYVHELIPQPDVERQTS